MPSTAIGFIDWGLLPAATKGKGLDDPRRAVLSEDLLSPCHWRCGRQRHEQLVDIRDPQNG